MINNHVKMITTTPANDHAKLDNKDHNKRNDHTKLINNHVKNVWLQPYHTKMINNHAKNMWLQPYQFK